MLSNANPVHPQGPDDKIFKNRSITFHGGDHEAVLTLSYPEPDEIVDWTHDGAVNVNDQFKPPLSINFNFTGHFWQGVFGQVGLDVDCFAISPGL